MMTVAEYRRHRRLLCAAILLQLTAVALFGMANHGVPIEASWLGSARLNSGFWFMLFWTWLVAISLIVVAGFWSVEMGSVFYLEAWRHPSPRDWMRRKLASSAVVVATLSGVEIPLLLLGLRQGEAVLVLKASGLLGLYMLHLALVYMAAALHTGEFVVPFVAVLAYNGANLVLDHLGGPNVVQFFLIGERTSAASFAVASAVVGAGFFLLRSLFNPSVIALRGSEYV